MSGGQGNGNWQGGTADNTPDWAAMAEAHERETRRKRLVRIGIGAVAALALAGVVTVAVTMEGHRDRKPSADELTAAPGSPSASAHSGCVPPTAAPSNGVAPQLGSSAQVGTADGHTGPALNLTGLPDGYAEVESFALNTCKDFTVSAVVRNSAPDGGRAAVSQGSDGFFSFYLGRDYWETHNQWVFKVQTKAEAASSREVLSTAPATVGQWTTLTGVYDARAKTISLYVDGLLAQSTQVPGMILSTNGPFEIGRARFKSQWVDSWNGSIADVQVWERALPPDVVAQLAKTRSADVGARATWFRY